MVLNTMHRIVKNVQKCSHNDVELTLGCDVRWSIKITKFKKTYSIRHYILTLLSHRDIQQFI